MHFIKIILFLKLIIRRRFLTFYLFTFFVLLYSNLAQCQNIAINGGFENSPTANCEWGPQSAFPSTIPATLDFWYTPSTGLYTGLIDNSPDYFNTCFTTPQGAPPNGFIFNFGAPVNHFGSQQPKSGDAYIGFLAMRNIAPNNMFPFLGESHYREAISIQLSAPMIAGQKYRVGFSWSNSEGNDLANISFPGLIGGAAVKSLGMHFSQNPLVLVSPNDLTSITPQVICVGSPFLSDTTNWNDFSQCYTAQGGEQYLTIACFLPYNVNNLNQNPFNEPQNRTVSYYYIDDVFVEPILNIIEISCNNQAVALSSSAPDFTHWSTVNNGVETFFSSSSDTTVIVTDTTLFVSDASCPDSITIIPINIDDQSEFLPSDTTLCDEANFVINSTWSFDNYLWSDNSNQSSLTVNSSGIYWLTAEVCQTFYTDSIQVNFGYANVNLGPDISTCQPDTIILSTPFVGSWLWQDASTQQTYNVVDTGIYILQVEDLFGCIAIDSIQISLQSININLQDSVQICSEDSIVLTPQISPTISGTTYLWSNGSVNPSLTVNSEGLYVVSATNGMCLITDSTSVSIEKVLASFSTLNSEGCAPVDIGLLDNSSVTNGSIQSWYWNFGDNSNSNNQNPTHNYSTSGAYTISLGVTSSNGCFDDTTMVNLIEINPTPIADFSYEQSSPNSEIELTNQSSGIIDNIMWVINPNDTILNSDNFSWNINDYAGVSAIDVCLFVTSNFGCIDSICQRIDLIEDLYFFVPNTFTPNGDGSNQYFRPVFNSEIDPKEYKLEIFNRWGELIFESHDVSFGWDGTYAGKLVSDGTFVWIINFETRGNSAHKSIQGHLNLIK